MRQTTLLGEQVDYEINRSKEATIPRIDVSIRGIKVVIPQGVNKDPEGLIQEKAVQVMKSKREFDRYRKRIPEREFKEGEIFPLLGKGHEVVVSSELGENRVEDGKMILSADRVGESSIKKELQGLYRRQARNVIEEILQQYQHLDINYENIKLKNQKTRWASCSSRRNLNFNWRIVMAPQEIIEYIVVHELVHLEEKNHSKHFWMKVASILPDYKERAKWLDKHSPTLIFSEEDY